MTTSYDSESTNWPPPANAEPPNPSAWSAELKTLYSKFAAKTPLWRGVLPEEVPAPYRQLLVHEGHMTETLEAHCGAPVSLGVLATKYEPPTYYRRILLRDSRSQRVVLFGLVRIHLDNVPTSARQLILEEVVPLGRILAGHAPMRRLELRQVLVVEPDAMLSKDLGLLSMSGAATALADDQAGDHQSPPVLYGRYAGITVSGTPAIDVLEVLAPSSPRR